MTELPSLLEMTKTLLDMPGASQDKLAVMINKNLDERNKSVRASQNTVSRLSRGFGAGYEIGKAVEIIYMQQNSEREAS